MLDTPDAHACSRPRPRTPAGGGLQPHGHRGVLYKYDPSFRDWVDNFQG